MKESFRDYVMLDNNGIYKLKKNANNIGCKYNADFIKSLSFCVLNKDFQSINELQSELGDDVLLFLYENPGRDYCEYYFHNVSKNYLTDDYIEHIRDKYNIFSNTSNREAWNEIYESQKFNHHSDLFIEFFKKTYPSKEYVNLSLPYAI